MKPEITLNGNISINLNKLPMVTAEELVWSVDDTREDNYITAHNKKVLDLNLPRTLCFQEGDIPIDIDFVDSVTKVNWYNDGMFLGKEGTDDEDGCGTEEEFIGYLPDRVLEDFKEGDVLSLKCAINEAYITIKLTCQQKDNNDAPFDTFEEALEFILS